MKRFLLLIVVLLGSVNISYGQYDAQFSQYWMAMGYYNPAVAGASDNLNLFALHRQQWVGIKGAPKSFFVSADMPVTFGKSIFGIGVIGFTESIGLFRNTHVAGQFAYKKNCLEEHLVSDCKPEWLIRLSMGRKWIFLKANFIPEPMKVFQQHKSRL